MTTSARPTRIAFVLDNLANWQALAAEISADAQVFLLDAKGDALAQMVEILSLNYEAGSVEAIHVLSHGSSGSLLLGSLTLDNSTLEGHAEALGALGRALSENGDILLYGCDVASSAVGVNFISRLAQVTGADVAASDDPTGATLAGGDWVLEVQSGPVQTIDLQALDYDELLGADSQLPSGLASAPYTWGGYTFQTKLNGSIDDGDPENPDRAGCLWDRYLLSGVSTGDTVRVYMGNSSTVDDYLQIERAGHIIASNDDGGDGERSYDAFVSWTYQAGDVIRATTYSSGYRGSYSLYISTSSGTTPGGTDIGDQPAPAPTAPTFTDSLGNLGTVSDTSGNDISLSILTGTLTATDSTPTGTITFSGGGNQTYGTLSVSSNGAVTFNPNESAINTLNQGESASHTFTVYTSDGTLSSSKNLTVYFSGANDLPSVTANATMPGILEDAGATSATNAGTTVADLFGPRFSDIDDDGSLKGIYIVSVGDTTGQGTWNYSSDGGTTWQAVTASSALLAAYRLQFVPDANWSGTSGVLTVKVIDNHDGQSTNTATVSITVAAVNDAPTFDSAPATGVYADTAGNDVTGDFTDATGTLTASDVEGDSFSFAIRGGTSDGTTSTLQGLYGTLTLTEASGAWSYAAGTTAGQLAAINALPAGAEVHDLFDFKVIDTHGAYSAQQLDVTVTGANDTPLLAAAISDQSYNGSGGWSYQIPAATFTDAEGLNLAYSFEVVDGDGNTVATPGWLSFDEGSRTFSGTPDSSLPLNIKVTASDSASATVSDTFTLSLSEVTSNANPAADNIAPTSTDDRVEVESGEQQILYTSDFGHFSDANGNTLASVKIISLPTSGSLTLDGVSVNAGDVIAVGDINAEKLKFIGTEAAQLTFQVSDGPSFSDTYSLALDVTSASGGITLAAPATSNAQASTWTHVYSSDPLSGFGLEDTVRIVVEATGGTVKLGSTTGLNQITTGYDDWATGTGTSIAFEGTQANINAALQTLQTNLGNNSNVTLEISAILGGAAYSPETGHYYEVVTGGSTISWTDAKNAAAGKTFDGLQGYLATITSSAENQFILDKIPTDAWMGATDSHEEIDALIDQDYGSDAAAEGNWYWVTGPEAGTLFSSGNDTDGAGNIEPATVTWHNWNTGEPNDSSNDEDYGQFYASGGSAPGRWNDLPGTTDAGILSYIVEYGGMAGDPESSAASATGTLTKIDPVPVLSLAGNANYTENGVAKALAPALSITDQDSTTLTQATVTISVGKVTGDVLAFSNDGSMGNISAGAYNAETGAIVLDSAGGTATLAQWQAALQAVTFASTSDNPGASRTISWQINDDGDGNSSNTATTSINITQVNDAPRANPVADQAATAGQPWSFNMGAIFADPEGQVVTYAATLADGAPLPAWLTFDSDAKTFSGNPPGNVPYLNIRVTGTDTDSAIGESTFTLNLASGSTGALTANNEGVVTITDTNGGTLSEGDTLSASVTDADNAAPPATVTWQWQVQEAGTWVDVAGARGQGQTLTTSGLEGGRNVRVQAFYTDDGGVAESPTSGAVAVLNVDDPGTVTINGSMAAGQILTASVTDTDGLMNVTPTYQWYRANDAAGNGAVAISGAIYSSYALTNADGGKYIQVRLAYTDNQSTANTPQTTSGSPVQLGAVAPVAVDDIGSATEKSGVSNAIAGAGGSGNLLSNDTDQNTGDTKTLTEVRAGSGEGSGALANDDGTSFAIDGLYGTLTVTKASGAWAYVINETNSTVEALQSGDSIHDYFNYTVKDSTDLYDFGVLDVTINGANDAPSASGVYETDTVVEDLAGFIRTGVIINDPDGGTAFSLRLSVTAGRLIVADLPAATADGVAVKGNDTSTLTLTGALSDITSWLQGDVIKFASPPNIVSNTVATLTWATNDGAGWTDVGSTTLASSPNNDAPIVDIDADDSSTADGNDFITTFRPRGEAVAVVDSDLSIDDVDTGDTLTGATVSITAGDLDNEFGTIFETLTSTAGNSYAGSQGAISISGNGTKTITLSGAGTHDDYEAALKTIKYENTNPNAYSGDRTITISVVDANGTTDSAGSVEASNQASFTSAAPNSAILVGQHIFLDGQDTGETVAHVIDSTHFVASGPISGLTASSNLSFATAAAVGSAVNNGTSFSIETANDAVAVGQSI